MRLLTIFLLVLLLSWPSFAYRSLEFGKTIKSASFIYLPSLQFKSQSWLLSYEKENIEAYVSSHKIDDLYLFGINQKQKAADWLTWLVGINGQKTSNTMPVTLGFGAIAGSSWGDLKYSTSFLTSYYANGGTFDYEAHIDYRRFLLGLRGLLWFAQNEGNLHELYWLIGYKTIL